MNQSSYVQNELPNGLSCVARQRDLITTAEVAEILNKDPQTVRKNYSQFGEAYGLKPVKIGNRLLWRVKDIALIINQ